MQTTASCELKPRLSLNRGRLPEAPDERRVISLLDYQIPPSKNFVYAAVTRSPIEGTTQFNRTKKPPPLLQAATGAGSSGEKSPLQDPGLWNAGASSNLLSPMQPADLAKGSPRLSEESESRMSSFQELVGMAKHRKLLSQKADLSADMKALKRRIYARLEERFHENEVDQLRVVQSEQKGLHMLSLNMVRLKMQGSRQGQLEGFSLADPRNAQVDLQSPNTVTALRVKAHKKQREIAEARFKEVKAGLELESHKLLAVARLERSDLRRLSRRDLSSPRPRLISPEARLGLPRHRQKFKQKVQQILRRALLRYCCLGLQPEDVDALPSFRGGLLHCPDASGLFANLRQGRAKICCQMIEKNRWLSFDRDRVRLADADPPVGLPPRGQAERPRDPVRPAQVQGRPVDAGRLGQDRGRPRGPRRGRVLRPRSLG